VDSYAYLNHGTIFYAAIFLPEERWAEGAQFDAVFGVPKDSYCSRPGGPTRGPCTDWWVCWHSSWKQAKAFLPVPKARGFWTEGRASVDAGLSLSVPCTKLLPPCVVLRAWAGLLQGLKPLSISVTQDPGTKGLYVADVWVTRDVQLYVALPHAFYTHLPLCRGGVRYVLQRVSCSRMQLRATAECFLL